MNIFSSYCRIDELNVHYLHAGHPENPCIVLLHGFPELAYSWRKNMIPLSEAGYYVIAPDLRGFGRTTGWDSRYQADLYPFSAFGMAGDMIRLVTALGKESVSLIAGHDSGAQIAAVCALLRPDIFLSAMAMSTPFTGTPKRVPGKCAVVKPLEQDETILALSKLERPRKHYTIYYSSETANADLMNAPQGLADWFRGYFYAKSADWEGNRPERLSAFCASELEKIPTYYIMNRDETMAETAQFYLEAFQGRAFPCNWLDENDIKVYAEEYGRTGFQGGLNGYRCTTSGMNARELTLLAGRQLEVPFAYLAGEKDWGIWQFPGAVETMEKEASREYGGTRIIPDAGHWVQQEQPEAVNRAILDFLSGKRL